MEEIWVNFHEIVLFGDLTLYQILGAFTLIASIMTAVIHFYIYRMFKDSSHSIGVKMKQNALVDVGLFVTTALMGLAALFVMPPYFWQIAYVSRVVILILSPITSLRLSWACYQVIKVHVDKL